MSLSAINKIKGSYLLRTLCCVLAVFLCLCAGGCVKPAGERPAEEKTEVIPTAEPTPEKRYTSMQLFDDPDYRDGFIIMGQDTVKRGKVYIDPANPEGTGTRPSWMIAQWNSGPCLYRNRAESAQNIVTDGIIKTVTFEPSDRSISLRLNTIPYYDGAPGTTDKWPHLLLEQSPLNISPSKEADAEKLPYYSCSADKMVVSLDIRMTDYKFVYVDGVNAAQFLSYYYVKSKTGNDFVWFGVPLFDNRGETGIYWAIDTAGSNQMIYSIASTDTYKNSPHSLLDAEGKPIVSDEWIHVEVDIRPHLEDMFRRGLEKGTFRSATSLDDLYISGVNIGWETIGSFDIDVQIRNFTFTGYIEEK
ncbi:MAG: hypothetical protein J5950_07410 [Clostridia bacterium]|nr:hypothetical protein [Clostridia bacterium]